MKLSEGDATSRAQELFTLAESARQSMRDDPFGNPVLAVSLAVSRMLESGALETDDIAALVCHLRDQAFADRASRLAAYIGGTDPEVATEALDTLARRLAAASGADWGRFRDQITHIRFAAVFTAHPTFALPRAVYTDLAERMAGAPGGFFESHRPTKPTLAEEFEQVCVAITHGRDALDRLNMALLDAARAEWPDRWDTLVPRPVVLSSWVGYDTDGRNDINWWDTLRFRLRMKAMQLDRLAGQLGPVPQARPVLDRVERAQSTVQAQIAACPEGTSVDADAVGRFAQALIDHRDDALLGAGPCSMAWRRRSRGLTDQRAWRCASPAAAWPVTDWASHTPMCASTPHSCTMRCGRAPGSRRPPKTNHADGPCSPASTRRSTGCRRSRSISAR